MPPRRRGQDICTLQYPSRISLWQQQFCRDSFDLGTLDLFAAVTSNQTAQSYHIMMSCFLLSRFHKVSNETNIWLELFHFLRTGSQHWFLLCAGVITDNWMSLKQVERAQEKRSVWTGELYIFLLFKISCGSFYNASTVSKCLKLIFTPVIILYVFCPLHEICRCLGSDFINRALPWAANVNSSQRKSTSSMTTYLAESLVSWCRN